VLIPVGVNAGTIPNTDRFDNAELSVLRTRRFVRLVTMLRERPQLARCPWRSTNLLYLLWYLN